MKGDVNLFLLDLHLRVPSFERNLLFLFFSEATTFSAVGAHMPSIRPSVETGCRDAAVQLACAGETPPARPPISMFDLYDALQVRLTAVLSFWMFELFKSSKICPKSVSV